MKTSFVASAFACASLVAAAPSTFHIARDDGVAISQDLFDNFVLYSQFAAATFCDVNNNGSSLGQKLTCPVTNNCPLVESSNTKTLLEFADGGSADATGYVAQDDDRKIIVTAFRGSISVANWWNDLKMAQVDIADVCSGCQAFQGAWEFYTEVRAKIIDAVTQARAANPTYRLIVTGHSIGAGITNYAAADFRNKGWGADVYAYGPPRVGNDAFAQHAMSNIPDGSVNYMINHRDQFFNLPTKVQGYANVYPEYYIDTAMDSFNVALGDVKMYSNGSGDHLDDVSVLDPFEGHVRYFQMIRQCKLDKLIS